MSALRDGVCLRTVRGTAVITRLERTDNADGSVTRRTVLDHTVEADVEVWIDVQSILMQMTDKAIRSRGKKAQALSGAVVVKSVNHRRVSP